MKQQISTRERVTLRLSPTLTTIARDVAAREDESMSVLFRRLIKRGLQQETESRRDASGGDRAA